MSCETLDLHHEYIFFPPPKLASAVEQRARLSHHLRYRERKVCLGRSAGLRSSPNKVELYHDIGLDFTEVKEMDLH